MNDIAVLVFLFHHNDSLVNTIEVFEPRKVTSDHIESFGRSLCERLGGTISVYSHFILDGSREWVCDYVKNGERILTHSPAEYDDFDDMYVDDSYDLYDNDIDHVLAYGDEYPFNHLKGGRVRPRTGKGGKRGECGREFFAGVRKSHKRHTHRKERREARNIIAEQMV